MNVDTERSFWICENCRAPRREHLKIRNQQKWKCLYAPTRFTPSKDQRLHVIKSDLVVHTYNGRLREHRIYFVEGWTRRTRPLRYVALAQLHNIDCTTCDYLKEVKRFDLLNAGQDAAARRRSARGPVRQRR